MPPRKGVAPVARKPNPISKLRSINAPIVVGGGASLAQQAAKRAAAAKFKAPLCPNKTCENPMIEDGVCHGCGTIVDDSNIVAEIQFGESASGAAVVQGSFISADSGAANSMGPAFRRATGGGESGENTVRNGRRELQNLGSQMEIPASIVDNAVQIFKICSMNNFIQGRRLDMVVAVCLYSACRKEKPCKVMLIDFADRLQVNVFKLGHCFKSLHKAISFAKDGIMPVIPEDLIFRFASRLEFGDMTDKVAQDAIRLVQRMSLDWMVMGRRPSGVCGACLILAARMNNFRRTVTEVVYIVKVTTHTIQKRLDEFKLTASSSLTVDEFINDEFLSTRHDPPSFYEKSEEFLKNKKTRNRKRALELGDDEDEDAVPLPGQSKRQRASDTASAPQQSAPAVNDLRRDSDGFAIPPQPPAPGNIDPTLQNTQIDMVLATPPQSQSQGNDPMDPLMLEDVQRMAKMTDDELVRWHKEGYKQAAEGDGTETPESPGPASVRDMIPEPREKPQKHVHMEFPESWISDENELEAQISEMVSDPHSEQHAIEYARAAKKAHAYMLLVPSRNISMDVHIGEDEFANDPEVNNCLLKDEEVRKKEKIWVNENKGWLREQQEKLLKKKLAETQPPKATRKRKKKARIGEGQTEVADSAIEATENLVKERIWSKKINYEALPSMFKRQKESNPGSAATSNLTSRAPSPNTTSQEGSTAPSIIEKEAEDNTETPAVNRIKVNEFGEEELEEDEDDYEDDFGQGDINPFDDTQDPADNFGEEDDYGYD
ncbi:transcription factor tfiiib complex subunit brf1 [Phlyctema vagabunda]|uniref:Transcription factor tfiiib complex subunit brf1 n=1 Tax=Phlyctema vagabunda TaxID=108571 RepID=A0ABR4PXI3_9HELO